MNGIIEEGWRRHQNDLQQWEGMAIRCGSRPGSRVSSTNSITSTYEYSYGTIDQSPKAILPFRSRLFFVGAEDLPWGEQ